MRAAVPEIAELLAPLYMKVGLLQQEPLSFSGGRAAAMPMPALSKQKAEGYREILWNSTIGTLCRKLAKSKVATIAAHLLRGTQCGGRAKRSTATAVRTGWKPDKWIGGKKSRQGPSEWI